MGKECKTARNVVGIAMIMLFIIIIMMESLL